MYILITSLTQPPEVAKAYFDDHCAWLHKYIDKGVFLASGPKKNHLGGGILVKSMDKKDLLEILKEDSYVRADVADYQIIDMEFRLADPELKSLLDA